MSTSYGTSASRTEILKVLAGSFNALRRLVVHSSLEMLLPQVKVSTLPAMLLEMLSVQRSSETGTDLRAKRLLVTLSHAWTVSKLTRSLWPGFFSQPDARSCDAYRLCIAKGSTAQSTAASTVAALSGHMWKKDKRSTSCCTQTFRRQLPTGKRFSACVMFPDVACEAGDPRGLAPFAPPHTSYGHRWLVALAWLVNLWWESRNA